MAPDRLVLTTAEKIGRMDAPRRTGDLFTVRADGSDAQLLAGQSLNAAMAGSRLQSKKSEPVAAELIDDLPASDKDVVIAVSTFGADPVSRAQVMDVRNGRRHTVARAPLPNAYFQTNDAGVVRAVYGVDASTSRSRLYLRDNDGSLALVELTGDRMPAEYYLFDNRAKQADLLLRTRDWIDPTRTPERRPIRLKARDGLELHGYLTLPIGGDGRRPMIVRPHGGPFGVADTWAYDTDSAILAQAGYAVLQVNFRGSGGRGKRFEMAGARQWGRAMQDDLTDAAGWAIREGVADPKRICIYGSSYGGYAALMAVAREPMLYRCAVGHVGVYDLRLLGDSPAWRRSARTEVFIREGVGEQSRLFEVSPVSLADRIQVPVFLAAGGEDTQAPIRHTTAMAAALRKAGVPVETLYYETEGHGFYTPEHQLELYRRLLAFLERHTVG